MNIKQLVVISGKGGTGKTIVAGAFAALAESKVMADCDVDAADLHLLLGPKIEERHTFKSGATAFIDKDKCIACGLCGRLCRFGAISQDFIVDRIGCEGCGFCAHACPESAIYMKENETGEWFVSNTRFGTLVHAKLGIAEENSGKLVSIVRKKAREIAERDHREWIIIDGSPGIGCPVIASISGADAVLVVTEPSLSGLHDAKRVIDVAKHFRIPAKLLINKYDLNKELSKKIEQYCSRSRIPLIGRMRFDKKVVEAMVHGRTVVEYTDAGVKNDIVRIWQDIKKEMI